MDSLTAKIPATDAGHGVPGCWYVVAPSVRLTAAPQSYAVCGRALSVWREGDMLRGSGAPLAEGDGYVWAWNGEGEPEGAPHPIPAAPGAVVEQGSVVWRAGEVDAVENTLDLIHTIFGHPVTHPAWWLHQLGVRPVVSVVVRPNALGFEADGHWGRMHMFKQIYTLPDRVYLRLLPALPVRLEAVAHHVPEGPGVTRFEYMTRRSRWPFERARVVDRPGGRWLHQQDRELVEALTRNRGTSFSEQHATADAYVLLYRKIRALALEGRWAEAHSRFGEMHLRIRL